jgi:dTDP-4-dehydrorhamnose reductase
VFDGTSHVPLTEDMSTAALGVYGKSKLEGEQELQTFCPISVIIRTSWLYSSFGGNFVKTMIKLGTERDALNVIFDQIGTPTYAADLAEAILQVLSAASFVPGIYHYSNEGVCSWYDFTKRIHKLAGVTCNVKPIETKDYPTRTPRPHYSVLNKTKIKSTYGIEIPYWEDSLEKCIGILLK